MRYGSRGALRLTLILVGAVTILHVSALFAAAQVTAAAITGVIRDETGGVIPGAELRATHLETGQYRTTAADSAGRYRFSSLAVGRYDVRVQASGFQTSVWQALFLDIGQTAVLDFTLKVSQVALEVTVSARAPLVTFNSGDLAYLVEQEKIQDLPLNGRNYTDLAALQPGVQPYRNRQGGSIVAYGLQMNVNGQEGRSNVYLLDGTLMNNITNGPAGSAAGTALGVEAIREFRVESNAYSAEFGRNLGGQVNAITRSGTNEIQGSLFAFHRNDNLDARRFFDREKPEFKRNQFGGSIGGPVLKDRTHFFGTYEGLRENKGLTITSVTPDLAARNGQLPDPRRPGSFVAVNPQVRPYLDLFPLPNGADLGGGLAEFKWVFPQTTNVDFAQVRVDHQFTPRNTFFSRYSIEDSEQSRNTPYPQFPNPWLSRSQFLTLEHRNVPTARMVQTSRFGFSRTRIGQDYESNIPSNVSVFVPGRPSIGNIDIGGLQRFGPQTTADFRGIRNVYSFSHDVHISHGSHMLKFGFLGERFQDNMFNPTFSLGLFAFVDLIAFMENRPIRFIGMTPESTFDRYWRSTLLGFYVQDDIRVLPNLTLNLGLRHEFTTVPGDIYGRDSSLRNFMDADATVGPPFTLTSRWKRFAPRVGFAWSPRGSLRTAVRGGFGVYYNNQLQQNLIVTIGNVPAAERVVIPGPTFPVATFRPGLGRSLRPIDYRLKTPNAMVWNLNLQRELPDDTLLTVGYAGSRGLHLMRSGDVNTVPPQVLSDGTLFFPPAGTRPNPAWGTIELRRGDGDSWYNAMVLEVRRRFSRGLQYQASYTFSRSIDTMQGGTFFSDSTSSSVVAFPDFGELDYNRGLSDFHAAHNFVLNLSWDLPSPDAAQTALRTLFGGWKLGGILTAQSGHPLTVFVSGNRSRSRWSPSINPGVGFDRPSLKPGAKNVVTGDPNGYFDTSAFVLPAAGTLGNIGRNSFIGPGLAGVDFSLARKFRIGEGVEAQFRAEFFNVFNRANFAPPSLVAFAGARDDETVLSSFGLIRDTVTDPRQIQFGLRIAF